MILKYLILILMQTSIAMAAPLWSTEDIIPPGGRSNPYEIDSSSLVQVIRSGKIHTQQYPVDVTGMLVPYRPIQRFIEKDSLNPLKRVMQDFFKSTFHIDSMNKMMSWVGLHEYPSEKDSGVYQVPYPSEQRPNHLMGFTLIERNGAQGFTFSCAECHSSRLFGKTVLGLTNRFPRANATFVRAKQLMPFVNPTFFRWYNGATRAESKMLAETKKNLHSVGVKMPLALGLDTSLAQVALSMNRRSADAWATKSSTFENEPRPDAFLDEWPADSKPAVWWNLKYKNRWLSDGSVVSGNPLFTNILWNEIGRGVDLTVLQSWLEQNAQVIKELTSGIFSIEPPLYTDFFPAESIQLERAKNGERIYNQSCAKCHGNYEKAWSLPHADKLNYADRLKTVQVQYLKRTPVVNVGTDPMRRLGMKSLEQLNHLALSKKFNIRVEAQAGYVPPPLVGIWARWPYMHNNSIPNLCALLTATPARPVVYYSGEANSPDKDFDQECNGYPTGEKTPLQWKTKAHRFDTSRIGLRNTGHDEKIFLKDGKELYTWSEKIDLIQFLQTL